MSARVALELAVTAWASVAAGFSLLAIFLLGRGARMGAGPREARQPLRGPGPVQSPGAIRGTSTGVTRRLTRPVLLLRPLDAPTAQELEALAHPLADDNGAIEHVVVSPVRPKLPDGVRHLPSEPLSLNRKVGHLRYALGVLDRSPGTHVLAIDADVAVDADLVAALVDGLEGGAALVTAACWPEGGAGPWARALRGLLGNTHHNFAAIHALAAGAPAISGKVLGLSARALEELCALEDHLGEDLELASRLHARGDSIVLCAVGARAPLGSARRISGRIAIERFARWMRVLRAHRPGLFPTVPLLFAPTWPLLVAAIALAAPQASISVALLVASRICLSVTLARRRPAAGASGAASLVPGALFDWLWGEALLLLAFVRALPGGPVAWRGRTFEVLAGGRLRALAPPLGPGLR